MLSNISNVSYFYSNFFFFAVFDDLIGEFSVTSVGYSIMIELFIEIELLIFSFYFYYVASCTKYSSC
jgi:hypothetical protein